MFSSSFAHSEFKEFRPTSAGMFIVHPEDNDVKVFGESLTLKLKTDDDDAIKIKSALRVG
jgi:hypothetical protein